MTAAATLSTVVSILSNGASGLEADDDYWEEIVEGVGNAHADSGQSWRDIPLDTLRPDFPAQNIPAYPQEVLKGLRGIKVTLEELCVDFEGLLHHHDVDHQ